jgi:glycosyltransferase involved in cell wall biosynthesis
LHAAERGHWGSGGDAAVSRILYISHDVSQPRGGVGVLYDHVASLRQNGFDAFVVHTTPGFRYPFGRPDVPVIDASSGLKGSQADVLVVPEDHSVIRRCREVSCRKVLFCQNHYFIFHGGLAPGETWNEFGFSGYMCVSTPIQRALKRWFGVDASVVRPGFDDACFAGGFKPLAPPITLACMPRKGPNNLHLVRGLLAACGHADGKDLAWLEIDGLPKDQVAARLRDAHIYVSTSMYEGLGLPPLEAMAAGCLVVGFAGGGGLDYAAADNGVWVPDDDPWALAEALERTLASLGDPAAAAALDAKRRAGRATAMGYTRDRFERELLAFWSAYLERG